MKMLSEFISLIFTASFLICTITPVHSRYLKYDPALFKQAQDEPDRLAIDQSQQDVELFFLVGLNHTTCDKQAGALSMDQITETLNEAFNCTRCASLYNLSQCEPYPQVLYRVQNREISTQDLQSIINTMVYSPQCIMNTLIKYNIGEISLQGPLQSPLSLPDGNTIGSNNASLIPDCDSQTVDEEPVFQYQQIQGKIGDQDIFSVQIVENNAQEQQQQQAPEQEDVSIGCLGAASDLDENSKCRSNRTPSADQLTQISNVYPTEEQAAFPPVLETPSLLEAYADLFQKAIIVNEQQNDYEQSSSPPVAVLSKQTSPEPIESAIETPDTSTASSTASTERQPVNLQKILTPIIACIAVVVIVLYIYFYGRLPRKEQT